MFVWIFEGEFNHGWPRRKEVKAESTREKSEGRNSNGWSLERWVLQSLASGV